MKDSRQGPIDDGDIYDIDDTRLDWEWQRQPRLYREAALAVADARLDWSDAKRKLELISAETKRAIRANPEHYGLKSATVDAVDAALIVQAEYQRAVRAVNDAKHLVDVCEAATDALQQKKSALEGRVVLFCRDYSSAPKVPQTVAQQHRDRADRLTGQGQVMRRARINEDDE